MLESATNRSLILLDEIGSSTEPGEGAALARAVLERFREIGAFVVATTHYNRLKLYAETTGGVANAAMEFNEVTLEPTYRLIHGLSGASSGLKIAERLQMPKDLLAAAVRALDTADLEAAHYVEELRRRISDLEQEQSRLGKERREFEDWKNKEMELLQAQHREQIAKVEKKLERVVQELSDRAAKELGTLQEDSVKKFQKKLAGAKAEATREVSREKEKIEPVSSEHPPSAPTRAVPLKEGQLVRVSSLAVTGRISQLKDDEAEVLVGNIKLRRPLSDLDAILSEPIKLPPNVRVSVSAKQLERNEINLVGRTVADSLRIGSPR
jgi:DNA mismatch repair protein MutS2